MPRLQRLLAEAAAALGIAGQLQGRQQRHGDVRRRRGLEKRHGIVMLREGKTIFNDG